MEWRENARCLGAENDIFFDESRKLEAVAVCNECVVKQECHDYATETRSVGTWAGVNYLVRSRRSAPDNPVVVKWH